MKGFSSNRFLLARIAVALLLTLSAFSAAQSAPRRDRGWEMGLDVVYQNANEFDFNGGSTIELDEDLGLSVTFAYRFNAYLETQFAFDWGEVDYTAKLVRQDGSTKRATGEMETFTPRFDVHLNLFRTATTPFVMAGVGYTFIDTNIPNGRPQTGCWWDPWYGYICTDYQDTKELDEFTYQYGVGLRSDYSSTGSIRVVYERHYLDISNTNSMPFADQVKVGWMYRY